MTSPTLRTSPTSSARPTTPGGPGLASESGHLWSQVVGRPRGGRPVLDDSVSGDPCDGSDSVPLGPPVSLNLNDGTIPHPSGLTSAGVRAPRFFGKEGGEDANGRVRRGFNFYDSCPPHSVTPTSVV